MGITPEGQRLSFIAHLQDNWAALVGEQFAESTYPVALDLSTGRLDVLCRSRAHYENFNADAVVADIRKNLGVPRVVRGGVVPLWPVRVLVTGSRSWTDAAPVHAVLLETWHDAVQVNGPGHPLLIVHGGCPKGADAIADAWAKQQQSDGAWVVVQSHPADWDRYGKCAGFLRNQEMVDAGADICLAFIKDGSRGASHTAERAKAAGIPVRRLTA